MAKYEILEERAGVADGREGKTRLVIQGTYYQIAVTNDDGTTEIQTYFAKEGTDKEAFIAEKALHVTKDETATKQTVNPE